MSTKSDILGIEDDKQTKSPSSAPVTTQPSNTPAAVATTPPAGNSVAAPATPATPATPDKVAAPATPDKAATPSTNPTPAEPKADVIPAEKKQLGYADMYASLNPKVLKTKEELEKEAKREKREKIFAAISDGISALSNLYFTTKGAPNSFDYKNSMSEKTRERWDKLHKDYDARKKEYLAGYMSARQADEEQAWKEKGWKRQLERDKAQDEHYKAELERKKSQDAITNQYRQAELDRKKEQDKVNNEHWDKKFEQDKHVSEVTLAQGQQRNNIAAARLAKETGDNVTFALGKGKGTISLSAKAMKNPSNVAYVFSKLPYAVRIQCRGEAIYDSKRKHIIGYKSPTTDDMLAAIGSNIEQSPEAQDALREIGGQKVAAKPSKPAAKSGSKGNGYSRKSSNNTSKKGKGY